MNVTEEIKSLQEQIARAQTRVAWLEEHRPALESLPSGSFCGSLLDFDRLEHADVVKVIRTLGGKWTKSVSSDYASESRTSIDYETEIGGIKVRCYAGKPPPSCKVVEIEEHVPEQIIPASVRKVRKLVCQPDPAAVIASAAEKGGAS